MTPSQALHYNAIHLLALAASGRGETLREIADALWMDQRAVPIARRALVASLGAGTSREVRAEAEARLRVGVRR